MTPNKKELFSERVSAGSRTYFFDVKESTDGTKYLVISVSRQVPEKSYEHSRAMVFKEHVLAFCDGLKKAIKFMEKQSKAYSVKQVRRNYPKAYAKWTEDEDRRLEKRYTQGKIIRELADILQRKPGAIRSRLRKLGLL